MHASSPPSGACARRITAIALCAATATMIAAPTAASAGIEAGKWKGDLNDEPKSKVSLKVKSAKKAVNFKAEPVPVWCGTFPGHLEIRTVVVPKLKIKGNKLSGSKKYFDRGEQIGEVKVAGKRKGAKLKGTVQYKDANCFSDKEKWTAKLK